MWGREGGRVVRAEREEATPSGFRGTTRPREACYDVGRGARGKGLRARSRRRRPTHPRVGVRVFSYATDGDAKNCVVPSIVGKASEPETRVEGETPFVAHAPGTHGSREPVSGAAACRRAHATANGHRRFALSINTHSREGLGEFSAPEKRVRARAVATTGRSPGVTTARSMRRRSRGRVGRYAPGATRPSARVRVTHPTPPHGCSSSFPRSIVYFFTPVTPRNPTFFPDSVRGESESE